MKSGKYTLYFLVNKSEDIVLEKDTIEVTLENADIELPDIMTFNNKTNCLVSGRIVDQDGLGVENARITITCYEPNIWITRVFTDANGYFSFKVTFEIDEERSYSIVPEKEGYSFSPDTLTVKLNYIKWELNTEKVLPDFLGYDYTKTTDTGFFPLSAGISWTYERTENEKNSTEHTVKITDTVIHNNGTYLRFSERGPWGFTDFRIEENAVYTYFSDEEILFLRFGVAPGTEWESGIEAGVYARKGMFLGTETVETPAGTFNYCAHFQSKVVYSDDSYVSYDLWYASDVGLVKSIKVIVSYGETLERVTDELKTYQLP